MFILKQTCGGCPEAYDVLHNGNCIGYLRLRYGGFTANYNGEVIYSADVEDGSDGMWLTVRERDRQFKAGCTAIAAALIADEDGRLFEFE